jgi:protocatechuate 3,4-dioxygenase beta subunit
LATTTRHAWCAWIVRKPRNLQAVSYTGVPAGRPAPIAAEAERGVEETTMCLAPVAACLWLALPAVASDAPSGVEARLAAIENELGARQRTPSAILADASIPLEIREDPRFREILRRHATAGELVLVPVSEAGEPLEVRGVIRSGGSPVADASIYVYQTDRTGVYSSAGGNATLGDSLNPRIFGYVKTDAEGRYAFRTIRPGAYPVSGPPAHIHYEISARGFEEKFTEIMFGDCARMTADIRTSARRQGFPVVEPRRDDRGVWQVSADFDLDRAR